MSSDPDHERYDPFTEAHTPSLHYFLGTLGAFVGGIAGYFLFGWLLGRGMYAMVVPGALIGLGCGLLLGKRSHLMGINCAIAALVVAVICQWKFLPFAKDDSLEFLLRNFHHIPGTQLFMMLAGAVVAWWCGQGRGQ
jgi:hypothetical protein